MKKEKWLIVVDLDGTLLKSSHSLHPNYEIHSRNIDVLSKIMKDGHEVAIVTGRPWRDTKIVYEKIGLKTILGNYNGAHIHNPNDKGFFKITTAMNRELVKELLKDELLSHYSENFIIEDIDSTYVLNSKDNEMMQQFHISSDANVSECDWNHSFEMDPQSIIFKIKHKEVDLDILMTHLRRSFGEAFLFRYWINKEKDMVNLEVNQKAVTKGAALRVIASYYNIPVSRTIAFGDGENDVEMLNVAGIGVAMKNANRLVKSYANDVTDYTNDEGGVGRYLEKYFLDIK